MITQHTYKPLLYFSMVFFLTFLFWFTGAYISFQNDNRMYMTLMLTGLMVPFFISLGMTFTSKSNHAKKDFISRLFDLKRIQPHLLFGVFLMMPLTVLVSIVISLFFGEPVSQFRFAADFSFSTGFIPVLFLLFLAAFFEELGWRGYAFDSLQARFTTFQASCIFSVLWSLWHLPLILVNQSYQYTIFHDNIWYAINFYISILPMGMIISWFCIKNKKSIVAAILFHFIINLSQELLDISQTTKCIQTVLLTLIAAAIIMEDKQQFFFNEPL